MDYDIVWVKGLSESDLVLCNLLSFMRLYKYNMRFDDVNKCLNIQEAEAPGVKRITVKLRTKDNNPYTPSPYYIHDAEADCLREKLFLYFGARG